MLGNKAAWFFGGRALYGWSKSRELREQNAGRLMDDAKLKDLLSPRHEGLVRDGHRARVSPDTSSRNLAVMAATGAGKTASFILPNLLLPDDGSIVVTDTSGTLFARTSGDLEPRLQGAAAQPARPECRAPARSAQSVPSTVPTAPASPSPRGTHACAPS